MSQSPCEGQAFEETKCPEVEEGAPLWTVTFGDMMSLLLTFFILMFSMSELKMERFLLASQSLREAVGGTAEQPMEDPMGLMPDPVDPDLQLQNPGAGEDAADAPASGAGTAIVEMADWRDIFADAYMEALARKLETFVEAQALGRLVEVARDADGVYLRIQTLALFASGSGTLEEPGRVILKKLSEVIKDVEVPVVVSGHADNRPIRTARFASNWELSAVRAAGVARTLVDEGHDPELLQVEAYGEYRPVASNETPEGRARNRRVELFYARQNIIEAAAELMRKDEPSPSSPGDSAVSSAEVP
ncbi:MAG: flagellar motor protein MotB [Gemmatimonadota bacterium]